MQALESASELTHSVGDAFAAHLRVVKALTVREMQSSNSSYVYGYAWALAEVCISVTALTVLKVFIHALSPPDMPPVLFILLGAIPWFTFHHTASGMFLIVSQRKKMLLLPQVTPIDLMLAKAITVLCTYGSIFFVALIGSDYFEHGGLPRSMAGLVLIYLLSWILGIAFGMIIMPLARVFPPTLKLLAVVWRFGLIGSGVYFTITSIPALYWGYLTWNPMLHVSELMRTYWFNSYQTPVGKPIYVLACTFGLLIFGLLLERYVRLRVPA
jgi:capsular polysaccharide transport system permease protein